MNATRFRPLAVGEEPPPLDPATEAAPLSSSPKLDRAKGTPKGIAGERFKTLNAFIDFSLTELSRAEIAVWLVLFRDTRDGSTRTAMADIARRAGCDRRTVVRAVARLEKRGLLQIIHRGGFRRGASRYRVRPLAKDA